MIQQLYCTKNSASEKNENKKMQRSVAMLGFEGDWAFAADFCSMRGVRFHCVKVW